MKRTFKILLSAIVIVWLGVFSFYIFVRNSLKIEKPFLWSVEKDGHESYVFGTVHEISYVDVPPLVFQKLDSARSVYVEADGSDKKVEEAIKELALIQDASQSADILLSPETWNFVKWKLAETDETKLKKYNIFALYYFITQLPEYKHSRRFYEISRHVDMTLDTYIEKRAHHLRKPVYSLDNVSSLLPDVNKCINPIFIKRLDRLARGESIASVEPKIRAVKLYRKGDENAINEAMAGSDWLQPCLVNDRNFLWLKKIENAVVANSPSFFVFGVGHAVVGDKNLITLLRKDGFKVERVLAKE